MTTTRSSSRRPLLPIRRLAFRYDATSGRFHPCAADDPRASMVQRIDARGHVVIDLGHGPQVGQPNSFYDPAEVRAFISAEAKRRRTTRKDTPR